MAIHLDLAPAPETATSTERAPRIRVMLAEDHLVVRRSMRALLDRDPDIEIVDDVTDLSVLVSRVHEHRPDVLLLDMRLPNGSSIDAIRTLRAGSHPTDVIALTMENSAQFAREVMRAGATGLVLKERADTDLLAAIRRAAPATMPPDERSAALDRERHDRSGV